MSDGTGSMAYVYDTWSHLTNETKTFAGITGSTYELQYTYNLAGQLMSLTDPWGGIVSYERDKQGQLLSVDGTNYANTEYILGTTYDYTDVTMLTFATNFKYRAWGGLKSLSYSNGDTLAVSYNNRLQITEYNSNIIHATYTYRDNGQISYMHDEIDNRFDRSYGYDDYGRLTTAKSGSEATGGSPWTGPYLKNYTWDVWGNLTSNYGRFWSETIPSNTKTYTNNRLTFFASYDADGNSVSDTGGFHTFDASGHNTYQDVEDWQNNNYYTIAESFDGDGLVAYRDQEETEPDTISTVRYYVRSTVLGGNVVGELTGSDPSWEHYVHVYANGEPLAKFVNGMKEFITP